MPLDIITRPVGFEENLNAIINRINRRGLNVKINASNFTQPLGRITDKANEWVGDFGLLGLPFNTIISVKSYSTKERALTSGSGSALCPTILYGHFLEENFVDFDKVERLLSYKIRGFTSIYMPSYTFDKLPNEAKNFRNINNNYFIRKIENFGPDISKTIVTKIFGTQKRDVVDPRKL